jgi:PKD repeat protein
MNNNYKLKFISRPVLILLLGMPIFSFAQQNEGIKECATTLSAEGLIQHQQQLQSMREANSQQRPTKPYPIKTVAVTLHIVSKTDGTGAIKLVDVVEQFKRSNALYREAGIEFYTCEVLYHSGDDLYTLGASSEAGTKYASLEKANTANVWFIGDPAGACGFANYPGSSPGRVVLSNGCVSSGTSLEHEFGHYFGLPHTHDDGTELVARPGSGKATNCDKNGDGFCDTPADPSLSGTTVNANTCLITSTMGTDANGDTYVPDPQNIMSYCPQKACRTIFSQEQLDFMNYNATTHASRKNLKCIDTTVAKTDFYIKAASSCKGNIQFYDKTIGTQPFVYQWTFPGGTPASSNAENPVVNYPAGGTYEVTLAVKTAYGFDQIKKSIKVKTFKPITIPYSQDFSDITKAFETIDSVSDVQSLVLAAAAGGKTNNGLILSGPDAIIEYFGKAPKVNAFEANPSFIASAGLYCVDLTNIKDGKLSFDYKMLFATSSFYTSFAVYINDEQVKFYSPTSDADEVWKTENIDLKAYAGKVIDIVFKGCNRSAYNKSTSSNATFVDNINITGTTTTGISTNSINTAITIFPNPSNGIFTLQLNRSESFHVEVYNALGALVHATKKLDGAAHTLDLSGLAKGLYTAKIVFADRVEAKKLMME